MKHLRLGTRASALARVQSRMIAGFVERASPGLIVEQIEISTTGDEVKDKALKSFGGAGVFVKELEAALLDKRIDIAVHSLKDVPTAQPSGLVLGAIVCREDTHDCVIVRGGLKLDDLPAGSVVGTGSERRRAQIARRNPELKFAEIRGNVETRIAKVESGQYDATILAYAGLKRLGLAKKASEILPHSALLPAPGQGALAIQCRSRDQSTRALLEKVHDQTVAICVEAERELLAMLGGGCNLPLGALANIRGLTLQLRAVLGLADGSRPIHAFDSVVMSDASAAKEVAARVHAKMMKQGAQKILTALGV
jgi:hydroxymethylbilane synthase